MNLPQEHDDQYKMLRAEALALADECRKLELTTVVAVATLYTWLATHRAGVPSLAWFIGAPMVLLAGFRNLSLFSRITDIATYLKEIEAKYLSDTELKGWEHYLSDHGTSRLAPASIAFWAILLLFSTAVPCAFILRPWPGETPAPIIQVVSQTPATPQPK